jgi:DNA-binding MarR family transcriptional regulator/ribosomal protein S18 acetylase RimI-like enzyme
MAAPTLDKLDELTLGSLLRRVTDSLYASVDGVYKDNGIDFNAASFPVMHVLTDKALSVTEIAERIGRSHSTVSQISKRLEEKGYLEHSTVEGDRRQRLLSLTDKGRKAIIELRPVWAAIVHVLSQYISETGHDLLAALKNFENVLSGHSFVDDVRAVAKQSKGDAVEIFDYEAEFKSAFLELNTEWLQKYFYVEEIDQHILSDPEKHILDPGGVIFFARHMGEIVGTAALINQKNGVYEISKMAVTAKCQGLGIGRRLLREAIMRYHELGGSHLYLESNSRLVPAIRLYESAGFAHEKRPEKSLYRRAEVYMVYKGAAGAEPSR